MANTIPPATPFTTLDPCQYVRPARGDALTATAFNVCAVVAAEHFRRMGWRGHHMAVLIGLAIAGGHHVTREHGGQTLLDALIHVNKERTQWDELSTDGGKKATMMLLGILVKHGTDECMAAMPTILSVDEKDFVAKICSLALHYYNLAVLISATPSGAIHLLPKATEQLLRHSSPSPEIMQYFGGAVQLVMKWVKHRGSETPMALEVAWSQSGKMFNVADETLPPPSPSTAPAITKARRLASGMGATNRERFISTMSKAIAMLTSIKNKTTEQIGVNYLMQGKTVGVYLTTFMREQDFNEFKAGGTYKGVWERGPTWHSKFSDQPLVARAHHELRLMGERGDGVTYGYLTTCEEWQNEVADHGGVGYGNVEVMWKPSILRYCTFCIEDSQGAGVLLDANDLRLLALVTIFCASFFPWDEIAKDPWLAMVRQRLGTCPLAGRFLEFQCHRPLTYEDVELYQVHEKGESKV